MANTDAAHITQRYRELRSSGALQYNCPTPKGAGGSLSSEKIGTNACAPAIPDPEAPSSSSWGRPASAARSGCLPERYSAHLDELRRSMDVTERTLQQRPLSASRGADGGVRRGGRRKEGDKWRVVEEMEGSRKLYTPGPGTYTPQSDRTGRWQSSSYTFGGCDRSHISDVLSRNCSPGPIYNPPPAAAQSLLQSAPAYKFPGRMMGSRFDLSEGQPSNCPHWNPGPAYGPSVCRDGSSSESGAGRGVSAPISRAAKTVRPEECVFRIPYTTPTHLRENLGVFSPGPIYLPAPSAHPSSAPTSPSFTLAPKCGTTLDQLLHEFRVASPGPIYNPHDLDTRGTKLWGATPRATLGRASREWSPAARLSAATFITEHHAQKANHGVHSPGPAAYSRPLKASQSCHVTTAVFHMSGARDRFYDRFEPQRVQ